MPRLPVSMDGSMSYPAAEGMQMPEGAYGNDSNITKLNLTRLSTLGTSMKKLENLASAKIRLFHLTRGIWNGLYRGTCIEASSCKVLLLTGDTLLIFDENASPPRSPYVPPSHTTICVIAEDMLADAGA